MAPQAWWVQGLKWGLFGVWVVVVTLANLAFAGIQWVWWGWECHRQKRGAVR